MKFLAQGFRKLEHEQDRQTDRQTDTQTHRLTDATKSSTIRFAGGNNRRVAGMTSQVIIVSFLVAFECTELTNFILGPKYISLMVLLTQ